MFEVAELGHKLSREEFDERVPALHTALLKLQRRLQSSRHAVLIVISGVEGAGKGGVVNRLNEWFDARGIRTTAFWEETDEQAMRPRFWRFWRALPPRGSIGILFGSWYTQPIIDRVYDRIDEAEYERRLQEIVEFERLLTSDGTIIIKLWFHLARDKVQKALKADAKHKPQQQRRVDPYTKKFVREFDAFVTVSEQAIRSTDKGTAPWHVVEAADVQYRDFTTGQIVHDSLQAVLDRAAPANRRAAARRPQAATNGTGLTVLDALNLQQSLDEKRYKAELTKWQNRLNALTWQAHQQRRSVVLVFEGWDAAGKGSTIRRITQAVDARLYQVISVAAPTDEECAHHYLWRFWRHLPMAGYLRIYDRSWYGRVLVERVEQLTPAQDWQRGYTEINLFEQQLCEHGIVLLKFWLHLSPDEQLRRFKEREQTPWKQYKITHEDWRNRDRWNDYRHAVNDMVQHTSTAVAPWHLVAAEDKKFCRIEVLKTVCKTLKQALK